MAKNLIVSLSPHVHGRDSVQRNMYGVGAVQGTNQVTFNLSNT